MTHPKVKKPIDLKIAQVDQVKDARRKIQRFPSASRWLISLKGDFENTYLLLLKATIFTRTKIGYLDDEAWNEKKTRIFTPIAFICT